MLFRVSALPSGLRHSLFSRAEVVALRAAPTARHVSSTARVRHFSYNFFTRTAAPTPLFRRKLLWLVPVAGGIALYTSPQPSSLLPQFFASPTLIPCSPQPPARMNIIMSPAEPDRSIVSRIISILRVSIWEPILTARRFVYLFLLFAPVLLSTPMLLVGRPEERFRGDKWGAVWWYGFLTTQMQRAGPTFIKLAQWAASRADLFPSLLCERLGALHSRGKAHSLRHTKRVIEQVFERPFHEVFEEFDPIPIGTGAIAQVYRATLKQDLVPPSHLAPKRLRRLVPSPLTSKPEPSVPTAAVAIKILHPHVQKTIDRDLAIMSFFAHALSIFPGMQWLSLPEEVDVFGEMMRSQLDLRHEAENLSIFEEKFYGRKLPVTFPRPLKIWTTKDILVEEYEKALPMEAFLKNGGGPYSDFLAEVGLDTFLNMLLLDNFVHSDLHPGNIMIKFSKPANILSEITWSSLFDRSHADEHSTATDAISDPVVTDLRTVMDDPPAWRAKLSKLRDEGYLPEIVFIDAGLVTTLNEKNRRNFIDLFSAIAEFDGYRAGMLMVERCRTPELAIDTETFALKMQHIVLNVKRKTFSLGQIKISDILRDVLRAVREHHVKMEPDFVNTVISILLLEGIGRQLDPKLDLFKSALPILRQLGRQMSKQESISQIPSGHLGAFLKVWVYMEARELASAAFVDADEMIRYDWLVPSV